MEVDFQYKSIRKKKNTLGTGAYFFILLWCLYIWRFVKWQTENQEIPLKKTFFNEKQNFRLTNSKTKKTTCRLKNNITYSSNVAKIEPPETLKEQPVKFWFVGITGNQIIQESNTLCPLFWIRTLLKWRKFFTSYCTQIETIFMSSNDSIF